jgi:hypothetical protein
MENEIKVFFVYVDLTLEDPPRPFYVGKGSNIRIKKRDRNDHWRHIAIKYGWVRKVLLATKDEKFALEEEKRLIKIHRTFYGHDDYLWGANKTAGGEGSCGHIPSEETRHKLSLCNSGEKNGNFGNKYTAEILAKISGSNHPLFGVCGEDHPNYGKKRLDTHIQKMCGPKHSQETRIKLKKRATKLEASLNFEKAQEIRQKYKSGLFTQKSLAIEYGVRQTSISNIINFRTWKLKK